MSLSPVADGELATIVTSLEMTTRPPLRPIPGSPLRLVRWPDPEPTRYRILFRRIGAPWLWFSRLAMADTDLAAILGDDRVQVFAVVDAAGIEVGMLELDFRRKGHCEIAYFGLIPELVRHGHGRWLMAETMARAWLPGVTRIGLNTCTLDHPSALGFYRKQGFTAVGRTVETFPDPRASGLLPEDAAPQIPYLASRR